ncbi:ATP-binding protein [Mycobacterium spongiae]|nr:HAMP domain-containing sensor histidine kinase [Mycobacterium spongiae]
MKETARSGYPGQLTFDYLDPRMDRRLRGLLAEVAAASRLRRIAGVFILFGGFMFGAFTNEIGVHNGFAFAALVAFSVLVATWLWARRSWKTRYPIAAHICIGLEITTLWVLFIIFIGYQHQTTVLYAFFIAAGAWLLLGKRAAIIWGLVATAVYSLRYISPDAASHTFGPRLSSIVAATIVGSAGIAALWAIDRQYRAAAELAVVLSFEQNAAVRLDFQYRLAETGRRTAALGHEIRPMLEELADIATDACRFVGRLARRENAGAPREFVDDLEIGWETIRRHSVRASSVAQTMTRSEIDRHGPSADELVDIGSLIQEQALVLSAVFTVEGSAHVPIATDVDELTSTLVAGRYGALAEMLQNLITNAVDSIGEKTRRTSGEFQGCVQITGRLLASEVEIQVIDNGLGLDPSKIEAYFEPFYTTKPPTSGRAGLGLLTARATLVELGGELTLEPEPHQGGAVATATLPIAVSAAEQSNRPHAEAPPAAPVETPSVQPSESSEVSETDAELVRYRTNRYRVATVLTILTLTIVGFGFADGQEIWIAILATQIVVSIGSWAWFEGNPGARFGVASRIVSYSVGLGAIVLAVTRGTVDFPLISALRNDYPPIGMLVIAFAVGYGFAGLRLSLEVAVPTAIIAFVGLVAIDPFALEPITLDPSLLAAGSVLLLAVLAALMLMPHSFSVASEVANRSRALLQKLREARIETSNAETAAALGRVSSGVLHEVANPLNFIQNFAKVILDSFTEYNVDSAAYRSEHDLYQAAVRTHRLSVDINGRLDSLRWSASRDELLSVGQATKPQQEL